VGDNNVVIPQTTSHGYNHSKSRDISFIVVPLGPPFPIVDEAREKNGTYLLACAQLTKKQIFQLVKI
jgi:hypothetical protein